MSSENVSTLFAIDNSGSTNHEKHYHDATLRIFNEEYGKDPSMKILLWNHNLAISSREEFLAMNSDLKGSGWTEPCVIADYIKKTNFHGRLVLITDGQVSGDDVEACTSALGMEWGLASTEVHLIETCETVNLSVPCPFTRNTPHIVFKHTNDDDQNTEKTILINVSNNDLKLLDSLDSIKSVAEYEEIRERLDAVVVARTMGSDGDPSLRDRILAMQKRLVNAQAAAVASSINAGKGNKKMKPITTAGALTSAVRANDASDALFLAEKLTTEYFKLQCGEKNKNETEKAEDDSAKIEAKAQVEIPLLWTDAISRLVQMCEGALKESFDLSGIGAAIQGDRARRAVAVDSFTLKQLVNVARGMDEKSAAEIHHLDEVDAISETASQTTRRAPDADSMVLLLCDDGCSVLHGVDVKLTNKIINCPLEILNHPHLVEKLVKKFDHAVKLSSLVSCATEEEQFSASPVTQRPIAGGIALGCSRAHMRHTNYAISKVVSDGKLLGSPDLWFAVIYRILELGQHTRPELTPLLGEFQKQLKCRLEWNVTFISMQGLPFLPTTKVPLDVALWYVFSASAFTSETRKIDGSGEIAETLRVHLPHMATITALQALSGRALPGGVAVHSQRLKALKDMFLAELSLVPIPPAGFGIRLRKRERKERAARGRGSGRGTCGGRFSRDWKDTMHDERTWKYHERLAWRKEHTKKPFSPRIPFIAKALYQNSIAIDMDKISQVVKDKEVVPLFIPIDGAATEASAALAVKALPPSCHGLPLRDLAVLASMVDKQVAFGKMPVPFDFQPHAAEWRGRAELQPVTHWKYKPPHPVGTFSVQPLMELLFPPPKISMATGRPLTPTWAQRLWRSSPAAQRVGFPSKDMWSVDKHFGEFVCKFKKYPNAEELLVFAYNRVTRSGGRYAGKTTLPITAATLAAEGIARYAAIMSRKSPAEFKRAFISSANVDVRKALEKSRK